ncbi:helix-turn-helix domain-containing protein [Gracilibacillus alcaliphilus]|uniref:helix-turn-helix domain-containing protein n=1 Tax=Gracilibacillus alcaliphilus TaxID=1401441 RepID=UPI00195A6ED0|nr:helix-turn-helix domain-containing protein [Gracilibacillus alcaliphilus]MBM7676279.1 AraC-like DNA-binding protein [Gracilibacillus alcaliphilus]
MIRSKLFIQYIISYFIVFLVPFVVMCSIIYLNSVSDLKEEIEQSNIGKLEQVATITDERINELDMIANRIAYDPRLTPYMMSHEYYSSEAINELKKYRANSSIIEEIMVYYHGSDRIYSSNGAYSLSTAFDKYNWDEDTVLQAVEDNVPLTMVAEQGAGKRDSFRYINYFVPMSSDSHNSYGTIVYLIRERTMNDLINNTLNDAQGNGFIISEQNQVIASSIVDEAIDRNSITLEDAAYGQVTSVKQDGENYSVAAIESEQTGWKFVIMMKTSQFFERLTNTILIMVLICISLFIVGSLLTLWLAKRQYQPIRSLFNSISQNRTLEAKGINELETIKRTVTSVFEDHEMLSETVYKHQSFAKDQFLTNIIKGDFSSEEEIDSYNETLYLDLNGDYYCSMIITLDKQQLSTERIIERETLYELFTDVSLKDVTAYGIDLLNMDAIALVVKFNGDKDAAEQIRKNFVKQIKEDISNLFEMKPMIGIGKIYDNKTMINRSYIEALAALEHKYFYSQGSSIYFEDIKEKEFDVGYPREDLLKVVQSIKQGDKEVAQETLAAIFIQLRSNELSVSFLRAICFDVINTVIKTITEIGVQPSQQTYEQIFDFRSQEQLHERLNDLVAQACKEVNENKKSHNEKLKNSITDYLNKNFMLYDLSLEKIAMEFRLSASYVSRFIKEQTGYTFKQYVQHLRMEEVKKQLTSTEKPIKAIVLDVGYKDVANFTRKFKNEVGMTPGKYRQTYM